MTDHANELRRHARKIPHPQGETPGVMLRAADEIERLRSESSRLQKEADKFEDGIDWVQRALQAEAKVEEMRGRLPCQDISKWPNYGAQPAPSVPMDVIADYLVSISAHLARRDDAKAQAEIGELLKMITSAPKPGASVPEDVMRDAERYRYLRARDDGTAGVGCWIEADGRVCDRGWLYGVQLDSAIDSFIEVLAAAPKPEAKP